MAGLLTSQPTVGLLSKTSQSSGSGSTIPGGLNLQSPNFNIGGQSSQIIPNENTPNIDPLGTLGKILPGGTALIQSIADKSLQPLKAYGGLLAAKAQDKSLNAVSNLVLGMVGGESSIIDDIVGAKTAEEGSKIATQLGIHTDLQGIAGDTFAKAKTPQEASDALMQVQAMQENARGPIKTIPEPGPAIPTILPQLEQRAGDLEGLKNSDSTFIDHSKNYSVKTMNAVDLGVQGTTEAERVNSAIANSERIKNQVIDKGQQAYLAGRDFSDGDLSIMRDDYQKGMPLEEIAAKFPDPEKVTTYLTKVRDYYDFELAADRAAGAPTPFEPNHLTQQWDLSKPSDLERFQKLAEEKGYDLKFFDQPGMRENYGFRSLPKIFKSYEEGISAGFTPKYANINEDLLQHSQGASNAISRQALKTGLEEAAPDHVSMSGTGITEKGKPFVNSNIPGLEGISYHPTIARMLKGYEPLGPDFVNLVKKSGMEAAINTSGIGGMIDKTIAMIKSVPANSQEAGFTGVLGSIYDHVSAPMKQVLWNWSGFHSLNITLNYLGASVLHPGTATKGLLQSFGSSVSERIFQDVMEGYKSMLVTDSTGAVKSVYDWAMESGAYEGRGLPAVGAARLNPLTGGSRAIFDREIPVLQLNLAEQAAKKGIVAASPEGIALGKEIQTITGEMSTRRMNLNPNNVKAVSRFFLSPGFTFSKYKTLYDAFANFGEANGAAGTLARTAVIGKSAIIGVMATLGTLLATDKFPGIQQLLQNFTVSPSTQTNITNPKGQKIDITAPKTFISEPVSFLLDPVHYAEARLNPFLSDFVKSYSNQDYYGRPIVDPNVPESAITQRIKNLGIGHLPIGAQAIINQTMGKQNSAQTGLQIAGFGTRVNANDPTMIKYTGIDGAINAIKNITPDDPNRLSKIQTIFNTLAPDQRKSVAYQEMMNGVKLKGIYTSEVERQYFEVQDLLQQGKNDEAAAITKNMSAKDYQTYKSIKTRLAHEAVFKQVQDLLKANRLEDATAITSAMTKQEYQSYQTWKKNNP